MSLAAIRFDSLRPVGELIGDILGDPNASYVPDITADIDTLDRAKAEKEVADYFVQNDIKSHQMTARAVALKDHQSSQRDRRDYMQSTFNHKRLMYSCASVLYPELKWYAWPGPDANTPAANTNNMA